MPRYYFRLTDGAKVLSNHKGVDLAGDAAARDDAIALAHHLRHSVAMQGWDWHGWFINVVDQRGHEIDKVAISDTGL